MNIKEMLKLNLQMFAEESTESTESGTDEAQNESETIEFSEEQQDKVNQLVAQAKSKAKAEAEKLWAKKQEEAIDNAVKKALEKEKSYSDLTEEERKKKELDDEREAFRVEREAFEFEKLITDIKDELISENISSEFAVFLAVAGDVDKSKENVKAFKEQYEKDLSSRVKKALQHPQTTGGGKSDAQRNYGAQLAKRTGATARKKPF